MKNKTLTSAFSFRSANLCRSLPAAAIMLGFAVSVIVPVRASAAVSPTASRVGFFFDTVTTISLYDTEDTRILDDCFELMEYYEKTLSRTVEGSDIWRLNESHGEPVEVSDDTITLITRALEFCELSEGRFDISIAPVVSLWDFHPDAVPMIPDSQLIEDAVSHVDYRMISIDGNTVTLADPLGGIDLGAIAKGYISDGLKDLIESEGCSSCLINLGGNVVTIGTKPDGSNWNIGIRDPSGESAYAAVVSVDDKAVITSGTYERFFELDGRMYHHILNPDTGYPFDTELSSVSILTDDATAGDALSTTCFALGKDKGMELIESLDETEALFITTDGQMIYSTGWPVQ